jgi:hypothetical protein
MNSCRLRKSANAMESPLTSLESGSKDLACEVKTAGPAQKHSAKAMSLSDQVEELGRTTTFGTPKGQQPFWTECAIQVPPGVLGPYSIRQSGTIGQQILDPDGKIIAWTTNEWVAHVIVKLLSANEGLLW